MNGRAVRITPYDDTEHRERVCELWRQVFGYKDAHNTPELVIDRKLAFGDGLFFVAVSGDDVIGTVMAGYDGHRGWIYLLAVSDARRRQGIGAALLERAEEELARRGCVKINLQILESNDGVTGFYRRNGYAAEKRISMGKRIPVNIPDAR